jgi:serine/threonine protein kinase
MTSSPGAQTGQDERGNLARGHVIAGRYRVEGKLGAGGIGVVYRAAQLPLERPVAVKVLHEDLLELRELRARFEREARVLSALSHPHVVAISDYGIDGDRPFLAMELLEGRSLEDVVHEDPLDPDRALKIATQLLRGLAFAHQKGIAHRDLKPANVFLVKMGDDGEHAKLLDFGLARMVENEGPHDVAATLLTKRGVVFGTPAYMSPEQASGAAVDERSDVYSMGVLLFELLAGRRPFVADTRPELLRMHMISPVPRLASVRPELRVDPALADVIDIAMAKEPADRYTNAGEMLEAIDAIGPKKAWIVDEPSEAPTQVAGPPAHKPPRQKTRAFAGPLIAGLVVAAVIGVLLAFPEIPAKVMSWIAPTSPTGVAARDPWSDPRPPELAPFVQMIERERPFRSRAQLRPLLTFAREEPRDPRPALLLGHLYFERAWYRDALARYEEALAMDPSVRGDPRVLPNVVELAAREAFHERAARIITRYYGSEAAPALDAKIEETRSQPGNQLRLFRLRERIEE